MKLSLSKSALASIEGEIQKHQTVETGGPLFGREKEDEVHVLAAYGPGSKARRGRTSLKPDRRSTQTLIKRHFDEGEGVRYVGEWHTHPGGTAVPSGRDLETLSEISRQPRVLLPSPIALIVATRIARRKVAEIVEMRAYLWAPEAEDAVQMTISNV